MADFYAARDTTTTPLPWPSIAPPFTFTLHYFSRGEAHTAFRDRLSAGAFGASVKFHEGLDVAQTTKALAAALDKRNDGGQVYMCGPAPFMNAAEKQALQNHPRDAVHLERFAANPAISGGPTAPFKVTLARTGLTLEVGADETILNVLDANGIDAAFSCEQGVCGTCVTDVVQGVPDHRDSFLSAKERDAGQRMCLCVSRARGAAITLDI